MTATTRAFRDFRNCSTRHASTNAFIQCQRLCVCSRYECYAFGLCGDDFCIGRSDSRSELCCSFSGTRLEAGQSGVRLKQ